MINNITNSSYQWNQIMWVNNLPCFTMFHKFTILILYLWVGLRISKSIIMEWKIRCMHKYPVWMELLKVVHLTPKSLWGYNVIFDVLKKDIFHTFFKCISKDNLWSITYGWHPHGWKLKHYYYYFKNKFRSRKFHKLIINTYFGLR
jgi:hypothetical protein